MKVGHFNFSFQGENWVGETSKGHQKEFTQEEFERYSLAVRIGKIDSECKKQRFEYRNQVKTLQDWAIEYNHNPRTIHNRIHKLGWTIREALLTPVESPKFKTGRPSGSKNKTSEQKSQESNRFVTSEEVIIDISRYEHLLTFPIVFRWDEFSWSAYIATDLFNSIATNIVISNNGYEWNCWKGCQSRTRKMTAAKIAASFPISFMR